MRRRDRRPKPVEIDYSDSHALPTDKPVAIYYRQSSDQQVGNVSTTMQKEGLKEYLLLQGWEESQIELIDLDAGVSGKLNIPDRPGAQKLYSMIEHNEIGAICVVNIDRLARMIMESMQQHG